MHLRIACPFLRFLMLFFIREQGPKTGWFLNKILKSFQKGKKKENDAIIIIRITFSDLSHHNRQYVDHLSYNIDKSLFLDLKIL